MLKHSDASQPVTSELGVTPIFGLEGLTVPRGRIPEGKLPRDVAYEIIHDELMFDGNARLNVPPSSPRGWSRRPSG